MTVLGLRRHSKGLGLSPRRHRAAPGGAPPAIVQNGLAAEWRFDAGAGQTLTDYQGGHHGTLGATSGVAADDPTWTAQGLSFDGGDYVTLPSLPSIRGIDIVFRPASVISSASPVQFLLGNVKDSGVLSLGSATALLTNEIVCHQVQQADGYSNDWRVGWSHPSDTVAAGWHLLQTDARAAPEHWNIVLDGVEKANVIAGTPQDDFLPGAWAIGSRAGAALGIDPYAGVIAYLIFYGIPRTSEQQAQNRAALTAILAARGITLLP
jgi:hypothetical protein